jgi:hypothetical protein
MAFEAEKAFAAASSANKLRRIYFNEKVNEI